MLYAEFTAMSAYTGDDAAYAAERDIPLQRSVSIAQQNASLRFNAYIHHPVHNQGVLIVPIQHQSVFSGGEHRETTTTLSFSPSRSGSMLVPCGTIRI